MGGENRKDAAKTVAREGALVKSVSMPNFGPRQHQLCIPIIDCSGSMMGGPIAEANAATIALVAELANPKNKGAFFVDLIAYASQAREMVSVKRATDVQPQELAVTVGPLGESTNITEGLALALAVVERPAPVSNWARPIVVLMSDGQDTHPPGPESIAARLKAKADIICVGFGAWADHAMLQRLATSPQHAFAAANGADLRRLFITVGKTMSVSIQGGGGAAGGSGAAALLGGGVVRG